MLTHRQYGAWQAWYDLFIRRLRPVSTGAHLPKKIKGWGGIKVRNPNRPLSKEEADKIEAAMARYKWGAPPPPKPGTPGEPDGKGSGGVG